LLGSAAGNVYTIVRSASGGITGTFTGLADGSDFHAGGRTFRIKYTANAVTLTDVVATSLAFIQQPTLTIAGQVINPAVTVQVLDQFNNLVTSDNTDQVTLRIASGPGTFTVSSTSIVTVSGGVATFSN